jgi:hypothetical protein
MQVQCSLCRGHGGITCSTCSGTKYVVVIIPGSFYQPASEYDSQAVGCPTCSARGYVVCPECRGSGYVYVYDGGSR